MNRFRAISLAVTKSITPFGEEAAGFEQAQWSDGRFSGAPKVGYTMFLKGRLFNWMTCFILVFSVACQQSQLKQTSISPEAKADLVVVLGQHPSDREISDFLEQNLIIGTLRSHFRHREGIASLVKVEVQGHLAYAVMFQPYATAEERAEVKKSVSKSPLVCQVFEDAAPNSIRLKEGDAK